MMAKRGLEARLQKQILRRAAPQNDTEREFGAGSDRSPHYNPLSLCGRSTPLDHPERASEESAFLFLMPTRDFSLAFRTQKFDA